MTTQEKVLIITASGPDLEKTATRSEESIAKRIEEFNKELKNSSWRIKDSSSVVIVTHTKRSNDGHLTDTFSIITNVVLSQSSNE